MNKFDMNNLEQKQTKITKKDIINNIVDQIEDKTLNKTAANEIVDHIVRLLSQTLVSGESIKCMNFGTFNVKERQAHMGYNPHTGEKIMIKPSVNAHFHASANVNAKLNKTNDNDFFM